MSEEVSPAAAKTSNLPLILILTALLIYFAFQTFQLVTQRSDLGMVKSSQEGAIQEAQKIEAQFKALVHKTSELADQGHAGAKMIMEELFNRGGSAAPQPSAAKPPAPAQPQPGK